MTRRLPLSSKLGFGVGQVGEGITTVIFSTFTLFFYNQVIGLASMSFFLFYELSRERMAEIAKLLTERRAATGKQAQ